MRSYIFSQEKGTEIYFPETDEETVCMRTIGVKAYCNWNEVVPCDYFSVV